MSLQEEMKKYLIDLIFLIISALSGVVSIVVPYFLLGDFNQNSESEISIFSTISAAWEGLQLLPTAMILVFLGFILGLIKSGRWLILGISSSFLLIGIAIVEMHLSPTSHNLWPFEFALYFIFISGPALIGTFIGSQALNRFKRT